MQRAKKGIKARKIGETDEFYVYDAGEWWVLERKDYAHIKTGYVAQRFPFTNIWIHTFLDGNEIVIIRWYVPKVMGTRALEMLLGAKVELKKVKEPTKEEMEKAYDSIFKSLNKALSKEVEEVFE